MSKKYKIGDHQIHEDHAIVGTSAQYPSLFNPLSEIRLMNDLSPNSELYHLELKKSKIEEVTSDSITTDFGKIGVADESGTRRKADFGCNDPTEETRFTIDEILDHFRNQTGLMGANIKKMGLVFEPPSLDDIFVCQNCGLPTHGDDLGEDGACRFCGSSATVPEVLERRLDGAEKVWLYKEDFSNKSNNFSGSGTWNWYNWVKSELMQRDVINEKDCSEWFRFSTRSALMDDYLAYKTGTDNIQDHRKLGAHSLKSLQYILGSENTWWRDIGDPIESRVDHSVTVRLYELMGLDKYIGV